MQQHCINRVNRELVDCINLPCVAVNSLSQLVWHVNIFSPPIQKDGIAKENESTTLPSLHLVVSFPENYPLCPPACYITTPYKHINVNQNGTFSVLIVYVFTLFFFLTFFFSTRYFTYLFFRRYSTWRCIQNLSRYVGCNEQYYDKV